MAAEERNDRVGGGATARKVAIVTGASSGIGEAIVQTLTDGGWEVVALNRQQCDLADLAMTAEVGEVLREQYPKIDALIHVAGIYHSDDELFAHRDLEDYSPAWIAATMNVGVTGFMILASRLLPKIPKDGFVVGVSGTFEGSGATGWLPYFTSKRALEDFLAGLADDYKSGPKVFGISPSDTNTPAYAKYFPDDAKDAQPANSVSLLLEHIITGKSPYHSGDIVVVKNRKAAKGFHI
jgi:NAD(P)-dependent dehydrogenase (short-subunit alcohol dehydrogenase family)